MKTIHLKSALISSLIVYAIAIIAFVASYFYPVMDDADLQANYVLSFVIIPAAFIGAHIYYRKGHLTNGIALGLTMFLIAIVLDALITVPFFIIPYGGDYISFFTEPRFWLIGIEYISVVAAYWQIEKAIEKMKVKT